MTTGPRGSGTKGLKPAHVGFESRVGRALWGCVWLVLYRPSPRNFHAWRRWLLRLFGAQIGKDAHPYPSARIWAPWNLTMADHSCISEFVDCYCVDKIVIGSYSTVSQYSFLCTASHDYNRPDMPLVTAPITIGARAWVTSDVFIGPGVSVGEGAVIGARSSIFTDVPAWKVVVGSPLRIVRDRQRFEDSASQDAQDRAR